MSKHCNYIEWAKALVDMYFYPGMDGQRARLAVSKHDLDEQRPDLGGAKGLVEACSAGPRILQCGVANGNFHENALKLQRIWMRPVDLWPPDCLSMQDGAPFFLPHLAVLCLGWTVEPEGGAMAANAFYSRLGTILPNHGLESNRLAEWIALWRSLAAWTTAMDGKRGVFEIECIGHMTNVGIPLAQVLITPSKVRGLRELFATTELAITWESVDETKLRTILLQNEWMARKALGMVFGEIQKDTEIGKHAISRILDLLNLTENREWEASGSGGAEKFKETSGNPSRRPSSTVRIRVVLESINKPTEWRCHLGILGEDPPDPARCDTSWKFRKVVENDGGMWLIESEDTSGAPALPEPYGGGEYRCEAVSGQEDDEVVLKLPERKIRLFHEEWIGRTLIAEADDIPAEGGCFLLVSDSINQEFDQWLGRFVNSGGTYTDYSRPGLPDGSQFIHLANLEKLDTGLRKSFPEPSLRITRKRSCIFLRNGSQVQGTGRQNVYLPYDLPDVVLVAPDHVKLEASGATLVESSASGQVAIPSDLPGHQIRTYTIEADADVHFISIAACSPDPGWMTHQASFAIGRDTSLDANLGEESKVRFDSQGRRTADSGILGSMIADDVFDSPKAPWVYEAIPFDLGRPATIEDVDHPAWHLLESLAHCRKVTAQEFRRRCEKNHDYFTRYLWRDARWLRALCHVEVERDNRSRIAYVHQVTPHAYLLPFKSKAEESGDKLWMAVIAGCPTGKHLRDLLSYATNNDAQIFLLERSTPLFPPRWLCSSSNLSSLETVLRKAGIAFDPNLDETGEILPAGASVANWAMSANKWKGGLVWLDGIPPQHDQEFNPYRFLMVENDPFKCPWRLLSLVDSLTNKHRWNLVYYRSLNDTLNEAPGRHAFLIDPSWGKWSAMVKISGPIKIPYEVSTRSLHVPASLVFPTMLGRALVTCSGMPPAVVTESPYFSTSGSQFLPEGADPYPYAVFRYDDIPAELATLVCNKVYAVATNV